MQAISRFLAASLALSGSLLAQSTTRASVDSSGAQANAWSGSPVVSADGRYVVFASFASNLVPGDTNGFEDIFRYDRLTGQTTRVSVDNAGTQANQDCYAPAISRDGNTIAFLSRATVFVQPDTNLKEDVFVRDLPSGAISRVSDAPGGVEANGRSGSCSLSADGRFVCFTSIASNLVSGDGNGNFDVFVRDRQTGLTSLASSSTAGVIGNGPCFVGAVTADGRYVAFDSYSTNLVAGDTNGTGDVFLKDLQSGATTRLSLGPAGVQGNDGSVHPAITPDGRFVAFWSWASNLAAGDTNGFADVYVLDRVLGQMRRASLSTQGAQPDQDMPGTFVVGTDAPAITEDGRFVAFDSPATDLVAADANAAFDVFVHDMQTGETTLASLGNGGQPGHGDSGPVSISADGRWIAFQSAASDLVASDTNNASDVFLRDRSGHALPIAFCLGDGASAACPCSNSGAPWHGCENSAASGGALLVASGTTTPDALQFGASGELATALSIFLQGNTEIAAVPFGDGLRCIGGTLKRLYAHAASAGSVAAPAAGDLPVGQQSALLGDPIAPGSNRSYQVYYRDANASFCPAPAGNTWNVSNAVRVAW